jgi:hypothetical protein
MTMKDQASLRALKEHQSFRELQEVQLNPILLHNEEIYRIVTTHSFINNGIYFFNKI